MRFMINTNTAQLLFSFTIFIISYFFTVNLNGIVQAFVANKLGDSTAKDTGYMKFDPLLYLSSLNFIFMLIFGIALPTSIPINLSSKIGTKYKLFIFYATPFISSILFSAIALSLSTLLYGAYLSELFLVKILTSQDISLRWAHHAMNGGSSFNIVCLFLLTSFICFNVFIAFYSFIVNIFKYIFALKDTNSRFGQVSSHSEYQDLLMIFAPLLLMILFGGALRVFILQIIILCSYKLSSIIVLIRSLLGV